ncbi:MAG: hypothetical protein LBQ59_00215 [Candidatus Peribacteria bacterium]|jgi:uncharacterized membrane protein affecting hemolysin expression|nr:hypothetical protein [Candidatus Peribacteria bacterium]
MKKNTRANIFIIVFILINLALIIAYVVLDNTFIMNNNLNFSNNSTELTKNLSSKADLNLLALKQYNSN